ncbi:hypothetical protein ABBQ38_001591 [Trebouxia sp. C0009 RCD-2024]
MSRGNLIYRFGNCRRSGGSCRIMSQLYVALIGAHWDAEVMPKARSDAITALLQAVISQCAEAGVTLEFVGDPTVSMNDIKAAFSRCQWDGVVVGFGVRSPVEFTTFFEEVVNAARENAPQAKFMFNTKPTDTLESIRRWFPQVPFVEPPDVRIP